MERNNSRRPSLTLGERLIFLAGILLCLILITTAAMGGLFARYVATETGHDTARVAVFDVNAEWLPEINPISRKHEVEVVCTQDEEESGCFELTVTNRSEVAVAYKLVITFASEIPDGVTVALDGETVRLSEGSLVWTKEVEETLPPNAQEPATHELSFCMTWSDSDLVNDENKEEEKTAVLDFEVDVTVSQVD